MRCFVAAWPSAEVVAALACLPRPENKRLRWSIEDQWHVTLRFFGELSPVQVDEAGAALTEVAQGLPGDLTARGGPATRFLGPGLLIWPVDGLGPAAAPVGRATAHIGQPVPDRPFIGHVTIARGARGADLRQVPHLLSSLSASWPVSSLALVHSQLGAGGARYRDIYTFPLGLRPPAGPPGPSPDQPGPT
ncbi:MAG: 2'-5' RNA ligase family protein [Acidimicrobiales bacterium]